MKTLPQPVAVTISELFRRLEARSIRYAVIRNYEQLPSLRHDAISKIDTDIDLVMDTSDIPAWRRIAVTIAEEHGWDAFTECDHWAQSTVRQHNIQVFRFYRISPLSYLQVDLFHGYLVLGLPLIGEQQMLEGRRQSKNGLLTHIDPVKENTFRILQIYALKSAPHSQPKVARYRKRVLEFDASNPEFRNCIRKPFARFAEQGLDALEAADMVRFANRIRRAKLRFACSFVLKRPRRTVTLVAARLKDHLSRYLVRQCGFVLKVSWSSKDQWARFENTLNQFVEMNFIDRWTDKSAKRRQICWRERQIMEQGGLVIKSASPAKARIDLSQFQDREGLSRQIAKILISRHRVLFCREKDWQLQELSGPKLPWIVALLISLRRLCFCLLAFVFPFEDAY